VAAVAAKTAAAEVAAEQKQSEDLLALLEQSLWVSQFM